MITSGFEYLKVKKKSAFSGEKVFGFYTHKDAELARHVKDFLDIVVGKNVYLRTVNRDAHNEFYFVLSVIIEVSTIYNFGNKKPSDEDLIEQRFTQIQNYIVDFEIAFATAKTLKIGDPVLLLHHKIGRIASRKCRVSTCFAPIHCGVFRNFETPYMCGMPGTIIHASSKRTHMSDCDVLTRLGVIKFPTLQLHPLYD